LKTDFYGSVKGSVIAAALMAVIVSADPVMAQSTEETAAATNSLVEAVNKRDLPGVKRSIARGADVNAEIDLDLTAVDLAIDKGYFKIAHYLLAVRKQLEVDQAKAPQSSTQEISTFIPVQPALAPQLNPAPAPVVPVISAPIPVKKPVQMAVESEEPELEKVKIASPDPYNPIPSTLVDSITPVVTASPPAVASVKESPVVPKQQTSPPAVQKPKAAMVEDSPSLTDAIGSALDSVTSIFKPAAKTTATPVVKPAVKTEAKVVEKTVTAPAVKRAVPDAPKAKVQPVTVAYDSNQQKPGSVSSDANAFEVVANEIGSVLNGVTDFFTPQAKPQAAAPKPVIRKVASGAVKPAPLKAQVQPIPKAAVKASASSFEPGFVDMASNTINQAVGSITSLFDAEPKSAVKPAVIQKKKTIAPVQMATSTNRSEPAKLTTPNPAYQTAAVAIKNPLSVRKKEPLKTETKLLSLPSVPRQMSIPLAMGETVRLERLLKDDAIEQNNCFQRRNRGSYFCVEDTDWSGELADKMNLSTIIYRGVKSVVRYDGGIASRYFSLLRSQHFEDVARSLVARYGSPDEKDVRPMALIGKAPLTNISLIWQMQNRQTGHTEVLEIRKYDNVRGMMPDTEYGIVRLFRKGSVPIFDQISEMDFILNR